MRVAVIVALCTGAALASAFSVTPNVAIGIGGSGEETVTGVAGDAAGSYYVGGWTNSTLLNSSFAAGGPAVTTYYAATYQAPGLAQAKNGFITKYSKYSVPIWSAWVGGSDDQVVNAVALSSDQTTLLVCGSYSGSDSTIGYLGPAGTPVTNALTTSVMKDVFVAGLNATTGAYIWSFAVSSSADDECLTIAEYNGRTVYGGYAGLDSNAVAQASSFWPDGVSSNGFQFPLAFHATPFIGAVATVNGASSNPTQRLITSPTVTHYGGTRAKWTGVTRALTFDGAGNLWVASSVETSVNSISATYMSQAEFSHDVSVQMFTAASLAVRLAFNPATVKLNTCPSPAYDPTVPIDGSNYNPDCVGWPGITDVSPGAVQQSVYFGSNGDDIVTGISVQSVAGQVAANFSRVVLTGYTTGATAGSKFRLQQYTETTDQPFFDAHALVDTPYDFTIPSTGETGWWLAQRSSFNGETGANFYAKTLPTAFAGHINAVSCNAGGECVAAGSFAGSGNLTVAGRPVLYTTVAGTRDAFVMRLSATGDIAWFEQTGAAGVDAYNAIAWFSGAGLARPGAWTVAGGGFVAIAAVTPTSASPIVVYGRGGTDGLMASYDDVDDCGLDPTPGSVAPYGADACNVANRADLNGLGAALCLDEPGFPLCFCHMNVTNAAPGAGFCNRRGWNCAFMPQYYFGLLDMCQCPAAANPHPENPLLDVAARLAACAGNVCSFGALTGTHANCLPLVLDLMATCGASPDTPQTDKTYIDLFRGFYAACNTGGASSSSTADDCTGLDFCAAPRAAAPASALVTAVATAAAALLIAANVRRS